MDHLTREGESYEELVRRVGAHPVARRVKVADLEDDLDVRRTGTVTEKDTVRPTRCHRARRSLTADAG